jgi:hypothetical protein
MPYTRKRSRNTKHLPSSTPSPPPQKTTRKNKFDTEICDNKMTFQECEVAILRHAVDEMDVKRGEKTANSPDVIKMMQVVEDFLMDKKLVCYGGTAINNILPKHAQFYNRSVEIPDYDFFSPTAFEHAKELADIFYKKGYDEVEAKTGVHQGTYKVFVNFISVADITFLHPTLYTTLKRESINIGGIRYAPANYLRMGMFLELSRPEGDVSRWEKVLKRLNLLNKHHPLHTNGKCSGDVFHRTSGKTKPLPEKTFTVARDSLIGQGVVFFGGYAASMYSRYMPDEKRNATKSVPSFDVLAENPERCATILKDALQENHIRHVKLIQHTSIGEVVPQHIEVIAENETVAYIYRPISCHSYNTITVDKKEVNIATIDTMLSFYLAFLYADKKYYDKNRILCMSAYLFQVEQHNRLAQKGVLKRFSTKCYGKQDTLEDMRSKKNQLFKELSKNRKSLEYEKAFLKYTPKTNTQLKRDEPSKLEMEKEEKTHVIEEANEKEDKPEKENNNEQEKESRKPPRRKNPTIKKFSKTRSSNEDDVDVEPDSQNQIRRTTSSYRYRKPQTNKTITEQRPSFSNMKYRSDTNEPEIEKDDTDTPTTRSSSSSWISRLNEKKKKSNFIF